MSAIIQSLQAKQLLWQGNNLPNGHNYSIDTGFDLLNQKLNGGWPRHGVVELQCQMLAIGELRLLFPTLTELAQEQTHSQSESRSQSQRLFFWISPPAKINPQALAVAGLPLNNMLIATDISHSDGFWLAEQALSSGCCAMVILWCNEISLTQAKRLQFAAKQGACLGVVIRPFSDVEQSLPVAARMRIAPHPQGLSIDIRKRLGGYPVTPFTLDLSSRWPELYPSHAVHSSHVAQQGF